VQQGIVQDYPPLCDAKGSMTAQFVSLFNSWCSTRSLNVVNRNIQSFFDPLLKRLSVEAMTIEYVRYYLYTPILFSGRHLPESIQPFFQSTGKNSRLSGLNSFAWTLPRSLDMFLALRVDGRCNRRFQSSSSASVGRLFGHVIADSDIRHKPTMLEHSTRAAP
jgi:hypothetical protein